MPQSNFPDQVTESMSRKLKYEYLDHTADIQIHAWGVSIAEAFEHAVIGMAQTAIGNIDPHLTGTRGNDVDIVDHFNRFALLV